MRYAIGMTALAALLALAACGEGPPRDYYIRDACKSAGFPPGTQDFDRCVADRKMAELRRIYDLAIRESDNQ